MWGRSMRPLLSRRRLWRVCYRWTLCWPNQLALSVESEPLTTLVPGIFAVDGCVDASTAYQPAYAALVVESPVVCQRDDEFSTWVCQSPLPAFCNSYQTVMEIIRPVIHDCYVLDDYPSAPVYVRPTTFYPGRCKTIFVEGACSQVTLNDSSSSADVPNRARWNSDEFRIGFAVMGDGCLSLSLA
jgi:hypothetical protein